MLELLASSGERNWKKDYNKDNERDEFRNPFSQFYKDKMVELFTRFKVIEINNRSVLIIDRLRRCLLKKIIDVGYFGQFLVGQNKF